MTTKTTSPPATETIEEIAERIVWSTVGKVAPAVYHEMIGNIVSAVRDAYEDAACIAENCTQDEAARDEPFRIAQTIRAHAAVGEVNPNMYQRIISIIDATCEEYRVAHNARLAMVNAIIAAIREGN